MKFLLPNEKEDKAIQVTLELDGANTLDIMLDGECIIEISEQGIYVVQDNKNTFSKMGFPIYNGRVRIRDLTGER